MLDLALAGFDCFDLFADPAWAKSKALPARIALTHTRNFVIDCSSTISLDIRCTGQNGRKDFFVPGMVLQVSSFFASGTKSAQRGIGRNAIALPMAFPITLWRK